MPEQHRFEVGKSTYIGIFSHKYSMCIFSYDFNISFSLAFL